MRRYTLFPMLRFILALCCCSAIALAADATGPAVALTLSGPIPLRSSPSLFADDEDTRHAVTLRVRQALRAPEPVLALDLSLGFTPGMAAAEELAALLRSERRGKHVVALIDGLDDAGMVVAAACDEVVIAHAGLVSVQGLALEQWYLKAALAKIGVQFHAVASGAFKTAHEPFTRDKPSPEAMSEMRELASALDTALAEMLAPRLSATALATARRAAPQTPSAAVALGLAHSACEPGEFWLRFESVRHLDREDDSAGPMAMIRKLLSGSERHASGRRVAVVELVGEIHDGTESTPGETICPDDTIELLEQLAEDEQVVAVVLRIDSPGGGAGASDRIHHAVRRLADEKPVVALCEGVAASGGYYIACAADEIFVHHATITGSIGVFALVPDLGATLDWLGITRVAVTTGPRADLGAIGAPWTSDSDAALRAIIQDVDVRFQGLVAECRNLDPATVAALAGGRVFTGAQAVSNGLADDFGTLLSAVARARTLAKVDQPLPVERLPKDPDLWQRLGLPGGVQVGLPGSVIAAQRWMTSRTPIILARSPWR